MKRLAAAGVPPWLWVAFSLGAAGPAAAARAPAEGELVIQELSVGTTNSNCDWFELANVSGTELDLSSCYVCTVKEDGSSARCRPLDDPSPVIPASMDASSPALLARDVSSCRLPGEERVSCVAWADPDCTSCAAEPTFTYSSVSFSKGSAIHVCLLCGGDEDSGTCLEPGSGQVLVDDVAVSWSEDLEDACDEETAPGGCAVQACGATAASNDQVVLYSQDPSSPWSFPRPDEDWPTLLYVPEDYSPEPGAGDTAAGPLVGVPFLGTPGHENLCEQLQPPLPGELAFTELMVQPGDQAKTEWVELAATGLDASAYGGSGRRSLEGCTLSLYRAEEGVEDPSEAQELAESLTFGADAPELGEGDVLVLAADHCIGGGGEPGETCELGELVVDLPANTFSNDRAYRVVLECPEDLGSGMELVVVDEVGVYVDGDATPGVSTMLDPDSCAGGGCDEANDLPENWCPASVDQRFDQWADTAEQECHCSFGTPGAFGEDAPCLDNAAPALGSAPCRCAPVGPLGAWPVLLLGGLAGLLRRRRA